MKLTELKKKTPDELRKELDSIQFELMRVNAQVATGGAGKSAGKIRTMRRTVARIKTLQQIVSAKTAASASSPSRLQEKSKKKQPEVRANR